MSEWISWEEAVHVVARSFSRDRADLLLEEAILRGALLVRTSDQGYTTKYPDLPYVPDNPDYPYAVGEPRPYRKIEDVDLVTLGAWLQRLIATADAAPGANISVQTRRGGVEKADWETYERVFLQKVANDGYPNKDNVKGWQRQADVVRWLADLVERDQQRVSPSTLARHARKLMESHQDHP